MGPKMFIACYVCCREFGSRSIAFHEPKCLERWRAINRTLPPEKRSATPVKPVGWKDCEDTTWTCSSCQTTILAAKRGEHAAACFPRTRTERPKTTVISRSPRGAALSNNKNEVNDGTKRDPTVPSGGKTNSKKGNGPVTILATKKVVRPQTKILRKPTPNIKHPVIRYDSKENLISGGKVKHPKRSKGNDRAMGEAKKKKSKQSPENGGKKGNQKKENGKDYSQIPTPCKTCNRNVAPERLHSHLVTGGRRLGQRLMQNKANSLQKASSVEESVPVDKNKTKLKSGAEEQPKVVQKDVGKGYIKVRNVQTALQPFTCYICGRVFGKTSLPLHEINCLERWKRVNEALPVALRKPLPRKPNQLNTDENNDNSSPWQVVQTQLVPCSVCGRTFFSERLPVHQRVCKGKPVSISPQSLAMRPSSVAGSQQSPSVTCYICGRQFGTTPVPVHESQCLMKWRQHNEMLPQHLQRPEPNKPLIILKDDGTVDIDAMADAAWKSHLEQLVPCASCGRTFFPDRLVVHERSCKASHIDGVKGSKSA